MSNEAVAQDPRMYDLIGGTSAVINIVAFTAVGVFAFENMAYGAVAGMLAGVGSYLFLPTFFRLSAAQEEATDDLALSEALARTDRSPQLAATGLGLELGGIVMLVAGFALDEPDLLLGLAAGLAVAVVVSLVASVFLGR